MKEKYEVWKNLTQSLLVLNSEVIGSESVPVTHHNRHYPNDPAPQTTQHYAMQPQHTPSHYYPHTPYNTDYRQQPYSNMGAMSTPSPYYARYHSQGPPNISNGPSLEFDQRFGFTRNDMSGW